VTLRAPNSNEHVSRGHFPRHHGQSRNLDAAKISNRVQLKFRDQQVE
jgi:hypothetical protein